MQFLENLKFVWISCKTLFVSSGTQMSEVSMEFTYHCVGIDLFVIVFDIGFHWTFLVLIARW